MNKIMTASMAFVFAAFMTMSASVYAKDNNFKVEKSSADVKNLIGKDIKDQQGDKIGSVKDFLTDSQGRITVAIVSSGGFLGAGSKEVGVPFNALHYDQNKGYFTTDVTKDKLANAPEFNGDRSMNVDDFSGRVYGYYGMQPGSKSQTQGMQQPSSQPQPKAQEQKY